MTRRVLLGLTGLDIEGGVASVSRCIARAFDELVESNDLARVDRVLHLDDPAQPPAPPRRGRQLISGGTQPRFVWDVWRSLLLRRPDLLVFDFLGLARSIQLPVSPLRLPRYAIFVHGIELDRAKRGGRMRALQRAWRLLTNSEFTAGILCERFPELADRVRVVPLCVDPARTELWSDSDPRPEPLRREPAALIVGRMWAEEQGKGHDALLEAWPEVRRRVPKAELWVAGGGGDRARLENKAHALGVGDSVRFLGRVPDQELGALYQRASLFAMPSRQEGFGLVYAEAMLLGLPCLGSTSDAARELIVDGETGRLVPYGDVPAIADALASLLGDPQRCRALGEAARLRAREVFAYGRFRDDLLRALELPIP